MRIYLCSLVSLLLLAGCASDVANRYYSATKYPPKQQSEVQILHRKPEQPFIVIADFQSRGETPQAIQAKAAAIGADAVIITPLGGAYNPADEWAGSDSMSNTYSHLVGTAIKYQ